MLILLEKYETVCIGMWHKVSVVELVQTQAVAQS